MTRLRILSATPPPPPPVANSVTRRAPLLLAALLAALTLLLFSTPPASAQTSTTLLSNTGQTTTFTTDLTNNTGLAQPFTTGSNSAGYTLTSLSMKFGTALSGGAPVVTLRDGRDGAVLATFANPGTWTAGVNDLTLSTPYTLDADTQYWVVLRDNGASGTFSFAGSFTTTGSIPADAGGAAGFSFGPLHTQETSAWTGGFDLAYQIAVKGSVKGSGPISVKPPGYTEGPRIVREMVSNDALPDGDIDDADYAMAGAQKFHTGDFEGGYVVTNFAVRGGTGAPGIADVQGDIPQFSFSIRAADSNGNPSATEVARVISPGATFHNGYNNLVVHPTDSAVLKPDTDYFLYISGDLTGRSTTESTLFSQRNGWNLGNFYSGSSLSEQSGTRILISVYAHRKYDCYPPLGCGRPVDDESQQQQAATPPGAPEGFAAAGSSPSQIDMAWTAPEGEPTGYEVEWSADGSTGWRAVDPVHSGTDPRYSHAGLTPDTTYYYRVRGVNDDGPGDWSFAAAPTHPAPDEGKDDDTSSERQGEEWTENLARGREPAPVFAEATDAGIAVCWFAPEDAADEVTGYRALRRRSETAEVFAPHGGDHAAAAGSNASQCWTDAEVEEGTLYAYRVKAIRDRELSRWSKFASARAVALAESPPQQAANNPPTGTPTISGTAQVGETLTADASGIADANGLDNVSFSYQWRADGTDIAGATGDTYTLADADEGKAVSVTVSFTDDAGNDETLTSAATAAVEAASDPHAPQEAQAANSPATGAPTISGTAQVGETLTADASGITDEDGLTNASFSYQWLADGADIAGATGSSYTLTDSEEGQSVKVRVSFTDDVGHDEELTSAATGAVEAKPNIPATGAVEAKPNIPATGAPTVTGTAQVGETLAADTTGIADEDGLTNASFSYQWLADGADIAGATGSTYTLAEADEGRAISVMVSFTDDAGHGEELTSAATAAVEAKPNSPATGAPTVTGTAQVGETLTADASGIADEDGLDNVSFSYQWLADGADIAGATGSSYTLTDSEEGQSVKVRVSFTDDVGHDEELTSAATGAVEAKPNIPATGAPTVTGTAQVGETLAADTTGIADEDGLTGASFSYQWQADGADIAGATGSSYTLTDSEEGQSVKVRVSFTDDAGHGEELTSAATGAVEGAPSTPLTVSVENVSTSHDGENTFTFELRFSEEFDISYRTLRDHAFTVTGGTVKKAQRLDKPSNILWRITVRPNSDGQVTITLPITEDCDAQGAICTEDGRMLSNELVLTVSGP